MENNISGIRAVIVNLSADLQSTNNHYEETLLTKTCRTFQFIVIQTVTLRNLKHDKKKLEVL
jgi:hypothetical protein